MKRNYESVGQNTVLSIYCTMWGNTGGKEDLTALKILRLCLIVLLVNTGRVTRHNSVVRRCV
jgi:hypothetical protein